MTALVTRSRRLVSATRSLARIIGGTVIGQGLVFASAPLFTLLYAPGDLGVLAVVTSLAAVSGSAVTLGWERAITIARDEKHAGGLVVLATASIAVTVAVLGTICAAFSEQLATLLNSPGLASVLWIVPLTSGLLGGQRIVAAVLARQQDYTSMGLRNASQGVVQVATTIVLAPLGHGLGLVLGVPMGRAFSMVALRSLPRRQRATGPAAPRGAALNAGDLATIARRYRSFPLLATWSGLLNSAGLQAPVLLLASSYGAAEMGLIALAMRIVTAPIGIVAEALGQFTDGRLGHAVRESTPLRTLIIRFVIPLAAIGAGVVLVACLGAPRAVPTVFGDSWSGSVTYAQILAVTAAAQLVVAPVSRTLTFLEQPGAQLAWDSARLLCTCGAVFLATTTDADPAVAVGAWAMASVVSYAAMLVTVLAAAGRRDRSGLASTHA